MITCELRNMLYWKEQIFSIYFYKDGSASDNVMLKLLYHPTSNSSHYLVYSKNIFIAYDDCL